MSRLQYTRKRNDSTAPIFVSNSSYTAGRRSSPDHRDILSRFANDSLSSEILDNNGLTSHDIGVSELLFERQFVGPTGSEIHSEHRNNGSFTTIRSVSNSDGRSMRFLPELKSHNFDQNGCYSRRFHRHARDVSLAAPSNRTHWHLAKSHPTSSATPPSQFLKSQDSHYTSQSDFHEDGHSPLENGRYFPINHQMSISSLSMNDVQYTDKVIDDPNASELSHSYNTANNYPDMSHNIVQVSMSDKCVSNVEVDCLSNLQEIEDFFPEDLSRSRPSVIASGSSNGSMPVTPTSDSPLELTIDRNGTNPKDLNGVNLVNGFDHDSTLTLSNDNTQYTHSPLAFRRSSEPNNYAPLVKFERDCMISKPNNSIEQLTEDQFLHDETVSLYSTGDSSNDNAERNTEALKIFRYPPPIQTNFTPIDNRRKRKFRKQSQDLMSNNKIEGFRRTENNSIKISRMAFEKSGIPKIQEKLIYGSEQPNNEAEQVSSNHIRVTISHQKRNSSMTGTCNDIFRDCNRPSVQVAPRRNSGSGSSTPENQVKFSYFQSAMREVLCDVDRTPPAIEYENEGDVTGSCYESMKNFWKEAKSNTINQMCTRATGNFRSLSQVILSHLEQNNDREC